MANSKPGSSSDSGPSKSYNHPSASSTPCRNIYIHGYCKYADKGCCYNHDLQPAIYPAATPKKQPTTDTGSFKSFTNVNAATFQPTNSSQPSSPSLSAASSAGGLKSPILSSNQLSTKPKISPKVSSISPFIPKNFQNGQFSADSVTNNNNTTSSSTTTTTTPSSANTNNSNTAASVTQYSPDLFRPGQSAPFKSQSSSTSSPALVTSLSNQLGKTSVTDYSSSSSAGVGTASSGYDLMPSASMDYPGLPQYNQEMYYQPHTTYPLQYHLYAPVSFKHRYLNPHQRTPENYFIPNDLRESLQRKNEAALQVLPASALPELVHVYHSLVPLDTTFEKSDKGFGYPSWIYKACSNADGKMYALRRIEGFRLGNEKAMSCVNAWKKLCFPIATASSAATGLGGASNPASSSLSIPNLASNIPGTPSSLSVSGSSSLSSSECSNSAIVGLKEAFTSNVFGDSSLVFVYEYYPNSQTLMALHFGPESYQQMNRIVMSEKLIWSYIMQLLVALRSIHGAGLAARVIEPLRILVTDSNRIRLNGCGIHDVLDYENKSSSAANGNHDTTTDTDSQDSAATVLEKHQQEDITNLGKLILSLCNSSLGAPQYLQNSLATISKSYSKELYLFVKYILDPDADDSEKDSDSSESTAHRIVSAREKLAHLTTLSAPRALDFLNDSLNYNSVLTNTLSTELENGRLARLLCKLGTINERPEYNDDPSWSETGVRYPLKLFRDYVFHQTDEMGDPIVDLGYMLRELNKLDAGIDEQVMLMGRDNQTFMIVSYKELKEAVGSAFRELKSGKSGIAAAGRGFQAQQQQTNLPSQSSSSSQMGGQPIPIQQQSQTNLQQSTSASSQHQNNLHHIHQQNLGPNNVMSTSRIASGNGDTLVN